MSQDASGLFLLQQRDFNSYDTLAEAVVSITYPTEGKEIFIISENKYYYWNGTTWTDQAILFSTSAPDTGTLHCQEVLGITTIADGDLATSAQIDQVPFDGSEIMVFANGHSITVGNNLYFNGTSRTYEYVKGNIITNLATDRQFPTHSCSLFIQGSSTFLNFDKIKFKNVSITSTITTNTMFEGTAKIPCNISGGGTINFSDRLEKISRFIKIRNITIGNRGQLLVTYANANKGGNNGIRFKGDLPTGINKVTNTIVPINVPSYGYGNGMLSDPATISNI